MQASSSRWSFCTGFLHTLFYAYKSCYCSIVYMISSLLYESMGSYLLWCSTKDSASFVVKVFHVLFFGVASLSKQLAGVKLASSHQIRHDLQPPGSVAIALFRVSSAMLPDESPICSLESVQLFVATLAWYMFIKDNSVRSLFPLFISFLRAFLFSFSNVVVAVPRGVRIAQSISWLQYSWQGCKLSTHRLL